MDIITSRDNAGVKYACTLRDSEKQRAAEGLFFAEGPKLCLELAKSCTPRTAYATEAAMEKTPALESLRPTLIAPHVAEKLAGTKTSQGVFVLFEQPAPPVERLDTATHILALEGVQDPGNVGTLLRSAAAFGFDGVLLSDGCASVWAPKTLRASMGAAVRIPVIEAGAMPDAIAQLLNEGKVQLFCADAVDGEGLLNGDLPQRRRAELQEKYFVYLTAELAPRILTLNNAKKGTRIWTAGVDLGAYHAVHCRLRRPTLFAGAVGMGGIYDLTRFWGTDSDDMVLRCAPLAYLQESGIANKLALTKAEENCLILCAGQGAYEGDALDDTQALADLLKDQGMPAHLEVWGGDVSHDWYWWGKMWSLFAPRILEVK